MGVSWDMAIGLVSTPRRFRVKCSFGRTQPSLALPAPRCSRNGGLPYNVYCQRLNPELEHQRSSLNSLTVVHRETSGTRDRRRQRTTTLTLPLRPLAGRI